MNIIRQIKTWWQLQFHIWRQPYDMNRKYIWVVNKDLDQTKVRHIAEQIEKFRRNRKRISGKFL